LLLSGLGVSLLARSHFLLPSFPLGSFLIFYAIFSLLVGWFSALRRRVEPSLTEARNTLELRVAERTGELTKANEQLQNTQDELRRQEAYLAEAQRLSHTGSFSWNVSTGEIYWSEETCNIFEHDRAVKPTLESALQRIHPDDRDLVQQILGHASEARTDFDYEHRLLMPDGSVTFRSDLFYRLNVFPIEIPPLRERREDISLLVGYFIDHFARKAGKSFRGISKATLDLLIAYSWPGNIRELQNAIERSGSCAKQRISRSMRVGFLDSLLQLKRTAGLTSIKIVLLRRKQSLRLL
jgi:PAS domain-containing protein